MRGGKHMILRALAPALALCACATGEVTLAEAEAACAHRAQAAAAPTGAISIGAGNRTGLFGGISIGVTSDFLAGRDPRDVYTSCVERKTGQQPVTPLVITGTLNMPGNPVARNTLQHEGFATASRFETATGISRKANG